MYFPKHQYQKIKASDLTKDLTDKLGNFIDGNKEIVITSAGKIFDLVGINFDSGDFSKAKEIHASLDNNTDFLTIQVTNCDS